MNPKEKIMAILWVIVIIILVIFLLMFVGFSIDYQKTQCIESGGNWVTGVIGGEYSYFCMPK
jgi:hypothetical protein